MNQPSFPSRLRSLPRQLKRLLRPGGSSRPESWAAATPASAQPHPFDLAFGTDTAGLTPAAHLSAAGKNNAWNTAYYGIAPSVFHQAFSRLELDWERFTFVDLGSGKGRALLLASRYPFRHILGVELAPELNLIAAANIQRFSAPWQRCRSLEATTGDAAHFAFPPSPLVVFLYHPFLPPVLKQSLANLAQSLRAHPREAWIVYTNPLHQDLIGRVPGMCKLWEQVFPYAEEDAAADALGGTGDRVAIWRYAPTETA